MPKKVTGHLNISVDVECPYCGKNINLLECDSLRDDGWIFELLMPNNRPWSGVCKDFSAEHEEAFGEPFQRPHCGREVDIGYICY